MLHEPAADHGVDHASAYKTRLGIGMFVVYALIYAGFVFINLFDPEIMETVMPGGVNLAVAYGFGLIIFALILAVIYNAMCNRKEAERNGADDGQGDRS